MTKMHMKQPGSTMYRWLLLIFIMLTGMQQTFAQGPASRNAIDSNFFKHNIPCGVSPSYFASHAVTQPGSGNGNFTTIAQFPANAIVNCGKFQIYYEDLISTNPQAGFSDPTFGAVRRQTLCSVLTYLQTVFDFSNVPSNNPIRLYVDTSYSSQLPAPNTIGWYAQAGPFYNAGTSGIVNGYLHDYVTTGVDPTVGNYHASLRVNFDAVYYYNAYVNVHTTTPVNFYNSDTGPVGTCQMDLFTTLLHEMGHTLGFFSLVQFNGNTPSIPNSAYTSIDDNVYVGSAPNPGMPKLINSGVINGGAIANNNYWAGQQTAPNTHPLYSGAVDPTLGLVPVSYISHTDDQIGSFASRYRISPGDYQDYVMGPFGHQGVARRSYSKGELNIFKTMLGYNITSSYYNANTNTFTNHTPYCTRMMNYPQYPVDGDENFPECVPADFAALVNNTGSSISYYFASDNTIHDGDGDPVYAKPGSFINFRGCGNSTGSNNGNNHDQLTALTDGSGNIIGFKYTPRPNFIGRAQWGVTLYDGKESGSFVLYTIDVRKGSNVSITPGANMVLNGGFEEGTETKRIGTEESIPNSSVDQDVSRESRFISGHHLSDSHPFDYFTNSWVPFGGGIAIQNSNIPCGSGTILTYPAGVIMNNFPNPIIPNSLSPFPNATNNGGRRYQVYNPYVAGFYPLGDSVRTCHYYTMEFDAYGVSTFTIPMQIGFMDSVGCSINFFNYYNQPLSYQISATTKNFPSSFSPSWTHYSFSFWYCGPRPSGLLYIHAAGQIGLFSQTFLMDNLSLKEELNPPALTATITPTIITPCQSTKLTAVPVDSACQTTYSWTLNGTVVGTTKSITVNNTSTAQVYTVTVNDGCRSTTATYTLPAAGLTATIATTSYSAPAVVTASPNGAGYTYNWTGPNGFTASTFQITATQPGIYNVTVTGTNGCVGNASITLLGGNLGCNQAIAQAAGTITVSNNPNDLPMVNGTASDLLHYFGNPPNNTINTNNYILIEGTFTVDHDIIFNSCPNVVFASSATNMAKVMVNANRTLNVSKSSVFAATCNYLWDGIYTTDQTSTVTLNTSTFRDMKNGVQIKSGAILNCVGNTFLNNYTSLYFLNTPQNSNLSVLPNYSGVINGNTFTTNVAGLFAPYAGQKGKYGIYTQNTQRLFIGDYANTSTGNTFSNLMTGIYINVNFPATPLTNFASNITISNSTFQNINGGGYNPSPTGPAYSVYNDPDGSAIYAKNVGTIPANNQVSVSNQDVTHTIMTNCDKGMTVTGMNAYAYGVNHTNGYFGFSFSGGTKCYLQVQNCNQQNVYLGTVMNGSFKSATYTSNVYNSPTSYGFFNNLSFYLIPKGLSVSNFILDTAAYGLFAGNTITVNSYIGIGMELQNVGKNFLNQKNHINLTTNITSQPSVAASLNGMMITNCPQIQIAGNHVDGTLASINTPRTNVSNIYLENSQNTVLWCNHVTNMRYGLLTIGNCTTGASLVKTNSFYNHINGMLFRHLGTKGTLGNIGTRNYDCSNSFGGTYSTVNGVSQKVYRFSICTTGSIDNIFTTLLSPSESGGNNVSCNYVVSSNTLPVTTPPTCASQNLSRVTNGADKVTDYTYAENVARGQVQYDEFADVALWVDQTQLYNTLQVDDSARMVDPILDSFYHAAQNGALGNADAWNHQLTDMLTALENQDMATYDQLLHAALNSNNTGNPEQWAINETTINNLFLKYTAGGLDTLTATDSTTIANIALQCPMIGGAAAVYKARNLYNLYNPFYIYTDIDICNNNGSYRVTKRPFDDENAALLAQQYGKSDLPYIGMFKVYPNPANETVTVEYKEGGTLEIVNTLGQTIKTISLTGRSAKLSFDVQSYLPGIYFYRHIVAGKLMESGKLVIIH